MNEANEIYNPYNPFFRNNYNRFYNNYSNGNIRNRHSYVNNNSNINSNNNNNNNNVNCNTNNMNGNNSNFNYNNKNNNNFNNNNINHNNNNNIHYNCNENYNPKGHNNSSSAKDCKVSSSTTDDPDLFDIGGFVTFNKRCFSDINEYVIEVLGIKIYLDDIIILAILFFLYQEDIKDEMLYISLILILVG